MREEDPTQINPSLGRFARVPTLTELERFAYLSDTDRQRIAKRRGATTAWASPCSW